MAVVKAFARVKLDERVVKLLATLPLGSELEQLAMRGARYGFPGWVEESETKSGKPKTVYIDRREEAGAKARQYLSVAKTAQELAGRLLALVAMARYADERAVAQSGRSFYHLPVPAGLPWQGDIVDLIDELAAERLPDHLTKELREQRARERAEEERLNREREEARRRLEAREKRLDELSVEELEQVLADTKLVHGDYSVEAFHARERVSKARAEQETDGTAPDEEPAEGGVADDGGDVGHHAATAGAEGEAQSDVGREL